ncbi:MAG: LON peptidase substrate-binding domain-containing protein, partial [Chloroflexota bacterium]
MSNAAVSVAPDAVRDLDEGNDQAPPEGPERRTVGPGRPARRGQRRRGGRELPGRLPVLPLINTVVFPRMTVPLLVDVPASVAALRAAEARGPLILLVAQREEGLKTVTADDLYAMGTVAQIVQSIRVPDGGMQVVVQGLTRARVIGCTETLAADPGPSPESSEAAGESQAVTYLEAQLEPVADGDGKTLATEALMRTVVAQLEQLIEKGRGGQPDVLAAARNIEEPGWLADVAAFGPDLSLAERQQLLEIEDPTERLRAVSVLLTHQLEILDLKNKIQGEIQK